MQLTKTQTIALNAFNMFVIVALAISTVILLILGSYFWALLAAVSVALNVWLFYRDYQKSQIVEG